jgi:hypothetical protein
MAIRVMGLTALNPSLKDHWKKLACRVGKRNERGSELIAPAPRMSDCMSRSVSATPWFISQNVAAVR